VFAHRDCYQQHGMCLHPNLHQCIKYVYVVSIGSSCILEKILCNFNSMLLAIGPSGETVFSFGSIDVDAVRQK